MTDHSTRKGLKWGIAGGALAAAFLPVTLVGGAVVLGVAGATAGAARLRGRRKEVTAQLKEIVKPGESAIMCMVEDSMEADVEEALAPYATEIRAIEVDAGSSDAVREATKAAEIAEAEIARAPENEPINWG